MSVRAHLVPPSEAYKESYTEALRESQDEWMHVADGTHRLPVHHDASSRIPCTTWWLVEGDEYVGTAWIRHVDADHLLDVGGHIGYEIRPSKRGRGYGKLILNLAMEKARESGHQSVVLLCSDDNYASLSVIEANGGVRVGERTLKYRNEVVRQLIYLFELE